MAQDSQSTVTEINGCISQAAKRQYGLLKLATFLENCQYPYELVLLEKASSFWIKTLLSIFESHPVSIHAKLAHYCFYLIIQCSKNASPELSKTIGSNFVEKSINILVQSNNQLSKNALICLNELITNYRSACSLHKAKIETFVLSKLDSDSDEVVEWASRCYAKLPYLHKNQSNTDMWYAYFKNMLKNANIILNDIFEDHQPAVNVNNRDTDFNFLKNQNSQDAQQANASFNMFLSKSEKLFNKLNKEDLEAYYQKLLKRFRACTLTLGYMFEPLTDTVVIKIRSGEIVDFLKRLYFFDLKKLTANSIDMESKYLTAIVADLYTHTLTFSSKLFQILKTNLLTKANQISHMLAHFSSNLREPFLFNTIAAYYTCLREWVFNVGPNSGFNKYSTGVIEAILANIKPIKKNILTIDAKKMKHSVRFPNDSALYFSDKNLTNTYQLKLRSELICSALEFLSYFVRNFSYKLSYNQYEKIQQTIVDILLCVQNNTTAQKHYDQPECRLGLYTNLFELCHAQNNKLAPPLSIAVCLFSAALDDSCYQIKSYAQQSLSILRAYSCPILPIYLREYTIQSAVETKSQPQASDKSMLTLTNNLANNRNPVLNQPSPSFESVLNQSTLAKTKSENISEEESSKFVASNNNNPLNNSNSKNIHTLINNSLVDMKNTLNIQGAGAVDNITLKRKSPISEEELIKSDIKKPFVAGNRMNGSYYKNSNLKENGGGDSNGLGDEGTDEDLEIIDSEMEQDHDEEDEEEEEDDDEEDYSEDEYAEEDEDIPDEIDLDDEENEVDGNEETSSPEAINEKHLNRSHNKSVAENSCSNLNGQSSQSQPATESKADSRSDINQLLKETGGYEDESDDEEDEEAEDSDEIEEEIIEDDEIYHEDEENSESRTADAVLDLSAQVQPVTNTETLVSELDKLDNVVPSNSVPVLDEALLAEIEAQERSLNESVKPINVTEGQAEAIIVVLDEALLAEIEAQERSLNESVKPSNSVPVLDEALLAEIEAQERSLTESVQPIKAIESQTVDEQIKEAVNEDVLTLGEAEAEASNMLVPNETPVQGANNMGESEESNPDEAQTTVIESNKNVSVDDVSMEIASESPNKLVKIYDEIEIEKACADFKVDAIIVSNYDSDSETA